MSDEQRAMSNEHVRDAILLIARLEQSSDGEVRAALAGGTYASR